MTNENEIFNDNHYEIDALGIPLLAVLVRERYQFEKNRNSWINSKSYTFNIKLLQNNVKLHLF